MALPDEIAGDPKLARLAATAQTKPDTWAFVELKTQLNAAYGPQRTQTLFSAVLKDAGLSSQTGSAPLDRLVDVAGDPGADTRFFSPAGDLDLPGVRLAGGQRSPAFTLAARALFATELRAVTTFGRSNLRLAVGRIFSDLQGDEASRYPTMWWFDPLISGRVAEDILYDLPAEPSLHLDTAIDLTGAFSPGWGHCVLEFAPQLLLVERLFDVPDKVPLLLDANLPDSHYDLFRHLCGGRRDIVRLGFRQAAQVGTLWAASAAEFWPALRAPGLSFRPELSSIPAPALARLLRDVADVPTPSGPKRLFLARGGKQVRVANQDAMIAQLAKSGFQAIFPEELRFAEQLALVQGATHVIGAAGSQLMLALLFGAPDMRIMMFHAPDLEETPSLAAIGAARGQTILVVPGKITAPLPSSPHNSHYQIDPTALDAALAEWL